VKDAYGYFADEETVAPGRAVSRWASMGEFGMMNAEDSWRAWVAEKAGALGSVPPAKPVPKPKPNARRGGGGSARKDPYADAAASIFGDIEATSGNTSGRYSQADLDLLGLGAEGGPNIAGPSPWQSVTLPQSLLDQLNQAEKDQEKDAMEKIVGPIKQFDEYAIGFGMVQDAATSAYEAIVTGSESAGAAMKRVVAQGIMALGKDMLVRSLQEGAWAIADLAKGNIPGAAAHAKAGAMFLAGSVAAGSIAAGLGVGGGGGGGGYAAAGGIGGGARGAGEGPARNASLTVVMGDGFSDDSPRYRARRVRRAINQARGLYPESGATEPG
jgi:hypothetical protein